MPRPRRGSELFLRVLRALRGENLFGPKCVTSTDFPLLALPDRLAEAMKANGKAPVR